MNRNKFGMLLFGLGAMAALGISNFCLGQTPFPGLSRDRLKGKIKSVSIEREYSILAGKTSNLVEKIIDDEYDAKGDLIRTVEFGNGEKHTRYYRQKDRLIAQVQYFDIEGRTLPSNLFAPKTNTPVETDLCNDYSVRSADDQDGKVEREYETCNDGSVRATVVREFDLNNMLIREVRSDARNRRWESTIGYDENGNAIEFRYTVNDQKRPEYTQRMNYGDYKFDKQGNSVQATIVSQISTQPDRIAYQFKEKLNISYWD